jgi:ubiquinone biosynthesis accessory factor UbiK
MFKKKLAEDMAARIADVMAMSPAKDIEKNLKAALAGWLAKLDLVTREEFDVQTGLLARSQERLKALEARLAKLENNSSDATHHPE